MPQIIFPPAVPSLTIGGRVFTDVSSSLIVLYGNSVGGGALTNCGLRLGNGTAAYQVTAGKTLQIRAVKIMTSVTAANSGCTFLYCDNDIGYRSNTAPTNPIYFGGSVSNFMGDGPFVAGQFTESAINFNIPATKFAGIITNGAGVYYYQFYGYEV